jgi:hypothetical protein
VWWFLALSSQSLHSWDIPASTNSEHDDIGMVCSASLLVLEELDIILWV